MPRHWKVRGYLTQGRGRIHACRLRACTLSKSWVAWSVTARHAAEAGGPRASGRHGQDRACDHPQRPQPRRRHARAIRLVRQSLSPCLGRILGSADRVHLYTVSQAVPPSRRPVFKADPPAVQMTAQGVAARDASSLLCDPPSQPAGPRGGPPCNSLLPLLSPIARCRTLRGHATHTSR